MVVAVSKEAAGRVPQTGDSVSEGHADGAEGDPARLGAGGGGDAGGPCAERAAGEVEVLAAVGPPRRAPGDEDEHPEVDDHDHRDRGQGGPFDRRHCLGSRHHVSRRVSATTRSTNTSGKPHSKRCAPRVRVYSSVTKSSATECNARARARVRPPSAVVDRGHAASADVSSESKLSSESPTSPAARLRLTGGLHPAERRTPHLSCDRADSGPLAAFSSIRSIGTITRSVPPRSSRRNAPRGPNSSRSPGTPEVGGFAAPAAAAAATGLYCGPRYAAPCRAQARTM